mmetsp:Transcript_26658/g.63564  ORF Transcript_26658/g.63564 Transcript_26658/m.63564 type:complete len:676 (-) Transcript_26658:121-2148(-)|eukprot:CAMPEP_0113454438 /NCGR_PEP_ID=MMETSP0014_2-20120614/7862_1 /TAXON_ID=2857 /ORGANISM="Nitzschia sp." /LENGTH=675 /DNA_ID=CAMNT_0000345841 /DNA_START=434 /DNA_END=2461 /DNA_ORIENTATION=+ /assembly_acc=CAM_ASM_000159
MEKSSSPSSGGGGGGPDEKSRSSNSLLTLDTSSTVATVMTSPLNIDGPCNASASSKADLVAGEGGDDMKGHHGHDRRGQQQRRSSTIRYEPATHQRPSFHENIAPPTLLSSDNDTTTTTTTTTTAGLGRQRQRQRPQFVGRRKSFIVEFSQTKGPPQIAGLMMLIAIGLGCTIGVVPAVMTDRFARLSHGYDSSERCWEFTSPNSEDKPGECFLGSADAQTAVSTSNLISNVLTFVSSSLIGSLSDEYGRRGILILGLVLGTVPPLMLVLIQIFPSMSPWSYYSAHAMTGLVNWIAVALSSLADVLPQQYRAPGIGLLLAGFMFGFSLSPILSMLLSKLTLSIVSFSTVLVGLMSSILFLPETLPPEIALQAKQRRQEAMEAEIDDAARDEDLTSTYMYPYEEVPGGGNTRRRKRRMKRLKKWCSLAKHMITRPIRELSILNRNHFFRLISSLAFFSGMVSSGDQVLLIYYLEERLGFTNKDVSIMFFIMGVMGVVAQAFLLKPLNDLLGEKLVVALAFTCGAIDNTMYGLAKNKQTIFAAVGIAGLTGMAFPTISAIKANNVAESEQGRIQGALYSLQALASGIGPVALRYVYSKTQHTAIGPGTMFIFAAGLYLIAVCIACALPKDKANASRRGPQSNDDELDHDDGQYSQLISESSSSDEEDYGATNANTQI